MKAEEQDITSLYTHDALRIQFYEEKTIKQLWFTELFETRRREVYHKLDKSKKHFC